MTAWRTALLILTIFTTQTGCSGEGRSQAQKPPEPPEVAFVRSGCFADDGISPYGCQADSSLHGGGARRVGGTDHVVFYAKAQDTKWGVASVRIEVTAKMHCVATPNLGAHETMFRTIAQDPANGQPDDRPSSELPHARLLRGELDVGEFESHCRKTYGASWSTRSMSIFVLATAGNGDTQYDEYGPAEYAYLT